MIPESSQWYFDTFSETALTDPAVNADVGIVAAHGYQSSYLGGPPTITGLSGQHVWMTEDSSQSPTYDGSMNDALGWAATIHSFLANGRINAWVWWFLSDQPCCGYGTDNAALTDVNGNFPKRMWMTGNWSRFVRPGWHEVGVSNSGSLLITAFQNPTGSQAAVVVVNTTSNPITQTFAVGSSMGATALPYITSTSFNLAQQSSVAISGGAFTYTIPAASVTTFVSN
jgi:glucuronoarabinoxylan endo-1,4-beta-xylanase